MSLEFFWSFLNSSIFFCILLERKWICRWKIAVCGITESMNCGKTFIIIWHSGEKNLDKLGRHFVLEVLVLDMAKILFHSNIPVYCSTICGQMYRNYTKTVPCSSIYTGKDNSLGRLVQRALE